VFAIIMKKSFDFCLKTTSEKKTNSAVGWTVDGIHFLLSLSPLRLPRVRPPPRVSPSLTPIPSLTVTPPPLPPSLPSPLHLSPSPLQSSSSRHRLQTPRRNPPSPSSASARTSTRPASWNPPTASTRMRAASPSKPQ
jgi:hypothetical protein